MVRYFVVSTKLKVECLRFSSRTSVKDKLHGTDVALSEAELDLIHRLAKSENPDADYDP